MLYECVSYGLREWLRRISIASIIGIFSTWVLQAQTVLPRAYSVEVSAAVSVSPPRITLTWPGDSSATSYRISRKWIHDTSWSGEVVLSGSTTSWSDNNVSPGNGYEYQVIKNTSSFNGYGFIYAGINAPLIESRGKLVLIVENTYAGDLSAELARLEQDLAGDGWTVLRHDVNRSDSPQSVKALIQSDYSEDPLNVTAVFLFGRVPVAHSGNIAPDGHENHRGAWPADVYYGEMNGPWTDNSVFSTNSERRINWNTPGDGKFDQSVLPSDVDLAVGRVDLSDLTAFSNKTPSRDERDLLRQYLNKDHNWRHGSLAVQRRGLVLDNFGFREGDPIAGSAFRNYSGVFGPANTYEIAISNYFSTVSSQSYLWSWCSGGGSYYYSAGVGTSDDFALNDIQVVFTMFLGSYFGDWDNESNFLRAALGSTSYTLTSTYSGFPHNFFHHMALGQPIGHGIRISQNNQTNGVYQVYNQGMRMVHIALMGDPTLRLHPVIPPSALSRASSSSGVVLNWNASTDSSLAGYHVYRSSSPRGSFARVTTSLTSNRTFTDFPSAGTFTYMVRAIKLEQSASGTYYNPSQGIFLTTTSSGGGTVLVPPAAPNTLSASALATNQVNLSWIDAADNESGIRIERKTGATGSFGLLANSSSNITSFSDGSVLEETQYYYRVRAFNAAGDSPWSNEAVAATPSGPRPPNVPVALRATAVSAAQINFYWNDNSSDETGFRVERKTGSAGAFSEVAALSANGTNFNNKSLSANTEYFYRVRAVNAVGFSPYSSEVSAITLSPPVITNYATVTFLGSNATTQGSWTSGFGSEGYLVVGAVTNLPSSVQISTGNFPLQVWASSTTDSRGLFKGPDAVDRIGAAWSGDPALAFELNVTSAVPARVAFYFVDWDRGSRIERVEMLDAISGATLHSQTISNFQEGIYLIWEVKGRVLVQLTRLAGPNAVLSGIFVGTRLSAPGSLSVAARRLSNGEIHLRFQGEPGQQFVIHTAADFPGWTPIATNTFVSNSFDYYESTMPATRKYYRGQYSQ